VAGLARHQRQQYQAQIAVFEQAMTPAAATAPASAMLFAVAAEVMAPAAMMAAIACFAFMVVVMPVQT
jgi:hypothetical protein